jgi:hypothetical protein
MADCKIAVSLRSIRSNIFYSIVHDGRTSFRIHRGKVLFAGVMTPTEAEEWFPMPLPKTKPFVDKIARLKSRNQHFVKKFVWEEPISDDGKASGST